MRVFTIIPIIVSFALLSSCAAPPAVVQGSVVSCDQAARTVMVQDGSKPGTTLEFSIRGADVGADPNPGDIVRIAYHETDGKLMATRVMNISRQKELQSSK